MLLATRTQTISPAKKRWLLDYTNWLTNGATLQAVVVSSSSATCTVSGASLLGTGVVFFLSGGVLNETLTVSVQVTDSLGNIKPDTISFTVVAA